MAAILISIVSLSCIAWIIYVVIKYPIEEETGFHEDMES